MSMREALTIFHTQFSFKPEVVHANKLKKVKRFVVCGMGGSHLGADLLKVVKPDLDVHIHRNYGAPHFSDEADGAHLFIAISYSGNTEEAVSFARDAHERGLPLALITTGGALLLYAQKNELPHILIPQTEIQPRVATGFLTLALATLMADDALVNELHSLAGVLVSSAWEEKGKKIAEALSGTTPIIYTRDTLAPLASIWKITLNETGKTPAFYNTFPELNHNEIEGFNDIHKDDPRSKQFGFVFLQDADDTPRIQKRMQVTKELFESRGMRVLEIETEGATVLERLMNAVLLAHWTGLALAEMSGHDPEAVAMIEEFKKRIL